MEFGGGKLNGIKAIYQAPKAELKTNNYSSKEFILQRSTRQGCPLFPPPPFFTVAIESLAKAIRTRQDITGITLGQMEFKVALYADDLAV